MLPPFIAGDIHLHPHGEFRNMQGLIRASARLLAMGFVLAAVVVLALSAGLATVVALAAGILSAGVVGIVSVIRGRGPKVSAADEIAAMMSPRTEAAGPAAPVHGHGTAPDAMAPPDARDVDPEANMPRWRRPSLLEARRSDPTRYAQTHRVPMRFTDDQIYQFDVRIVRYAVVPVLDRPDEVHGMRVADLESGDEVQVLSALGTFLEIHCPNGERGYVHRTTLRPRDVSVPAFPAMPEAHDDALSALFPARGVPQA
jgi:hypothetical protein